MQGSSIMYRGSSNLDVLRSFAVTFVVLSHLLMEKSYLGEGGYRSQILGNLGVLIFFVHTCLVLMLSLERQRQKDNAFPATSLFLVARAFRIYPLSIVVVILVSSIAWSTSNTPPGGWVVVSNLFLIQNLTGHASVPPTLWSLPFELQMYVFLPALYMLVSYTGKFAPYYIGALWFGFVVLIFAFWRLGWGYSLIIFFPCFLPGVLAFCLRGSSRNVPPLVLFLFVGVMAILYPWIVGHGVKATMLSWPICLALGLIIPRCREIESRQVQLAGTLIARYSYGIYLLHYPMLYIAFHYVESESPVIPWIVFFTGTIGLSCIAYHMIEKPCTEFGRTIVERLMTYRMQQKGHV